MERNARTTMAGILAHIKRLLSLALDLTPWLRTGRRRVAVTLAEVNAPSFCADATRDALSIANSGFTV